jgi:hypothetical protein
MFFRFLLMGLVASLAYLSDCVIFDHQSAMSELKVNGECSPDCMAYQISDSAHKLHLIDEYALGAMFLSSIFCLSKTLAKTGLFQLCWALGLSVILGVSGITILLGIVADGAEAQFGTNLGLMESLAPSILMEFGIVITTITLLYLGPFRGWFGEES